MNVLSLFDGMSCGQIALNRAGIKYDNYFASEIDKPAIKVTMANYPNTIQIGSVTEVKAENLPKIDLLIGGSPCQGFSFAGKQLNFDDPRSKLFFEYVRLLKECKPKYFLLENVKMKKEYQDVISEHLGVEPIRIDSSIVSAQQRVRFYWTNITVVGQPADKNIFLDSIIEHREDHKFLPKTRLDYSNYNKLLVDKTIHNYTATQIGQSRNFGNRINSRGKAFTLRAINPNGVIDPDYNIREFTPLECERLQTVPDNYTEIDGVSRKDRIFMLGNGWTIDIIAHIFKGIKE